MVLTNLYSSCSCISNRLLLTPLKHKSGTSCAYQWNNMFVQWETCGAGSTLGQLLQPDAQSTWRLQQVSDVVKGSSGALLSWRLSIFLFSVLVIRSSCVLVSSSSDWICDLSPGSLYLKVVIVSHVWRTKSIICLNMLSASFYFLSP